MVEGDGRGDEQYTQHILTPTTSGLVMNMQMTTVLAVISGLMLGMIHAVLYQLESGIEFDEAR